MATPEAHTPLTGKENFEMTRRSVVEDMLPPELLEVRKGLFTQLNQVQKDIDLVNDVLLGYGYTELILDDLAGQAYDAANDGTVGAKEHPEDSKWAGINPRIVPSNN
jgi:hypothetical protein